MRRRILLAVLVLAAAVAGLVVLARHRGVSDHYTGFVEGEERIIRSEVTGRALETACAEGRTLAAGDPLVRLDDREMAARVEAQRRDVAVLDASVAAQGERVRLVEDTWRHARDAQQAALRAAEASALVAARSFEREQALVRAGASTRQQLDDARAARDETASAVAQARQVLARAEAEERTVAVARHELGVLEAQRARAEAHLRELQVMLDKFTVAAPAVETIVVKQAVGRFAARSLHPTEACRRIREGAAASLRRRHEPLHLPGPIHLEVEFAATQMTDMAELVPGAVRTGGRTLEYRHDDYREVFRAWRALYNLASVE